MAKKSLDAILSQYEKNTEPKEHKSKLSNEERLKKYFSEKLPEKVKTQTKTFRILPGKDEESPFDEVYYHEKEVNGKFEKIYCLHHNDGEHCPLCEAKDALYEEGTEKAKKLASALVARKFYVVKGIDRDKEEDGVKFWRFKHNYKGNGIYDKLMSIFKLKGDITDPREGRDIVISSGRDDKNYTVVNSIIPEDISILTKDKDKAKDWFNNVETHRDVYAKKSLEYMEIIAVNKTPVWDSESSKFISKEDKEEKEANREVASLSEEINMMSSKGKDKTPKTTKTVKKPIVIEDDEDEDDDDIETQDLDDDDELPF
jgi:hypothetical protein